jgi:hypothetical protein
MGNPDRAALPTALFLALLQAPSLAQQAEPIVSAGAHFTIELVPGALPDDQRSAFGKQALELLEAAWPVFEKAVQPRDPAKATLRLYGDEAAYRAIETKLKPEAMASCVVVVDDGSAAHVLLTPLSPQALQQNGLPPTTRQNLLFAAGKQLALRQLGNRANEWVGDLIGIGLLEAVANPQRRLGVDLAYDARRACIVHADLYASGVELLAVLGEVKSANDAVELSGYYDRQALLAEQLAQRAPNWAQRLITGWPATPGASAGTKDRYAPVEALLGKEWKKTQEKFEKSWKGVKLPWEIGGDVWRRGDDWILAGTKTDRASLVAQRQTPPGDWTLRCTLQWEPTDDAQGPRILLDWNGKSLIRVLLTPAELRCDVAGKDAKVLDEVDSTPIAVTAGQPVDLRVDVVGKKLTIALDGKTAFERPFPNRGMHDGFAFDVGCSMLQVRGLKIEAKTAKK